MFLNIYFELVRKLYGAVACSYNHSVPCLMDAGMSGMDSRNGGGSSMSKMNGGKSFRSGSDKSVRGRKSRGGYSEEMSKKGSKSYDMSDKWSSSDEMSGRSSSYSDEMRSQFGDMSWMQSGSAENSGRGSNSGDKGSMEMDGEIQEMMMKLHHYAMILGQMCDNEHAGDIVDNILRAGGSRMSLGVLLSQPYTTEADICM